MAGPYPKTFKECRTELRQCRIDRNTFEDTALELERQLKMANEQAEAATEALEMTNLRYQGMHAAMVAIHNEVLLPGDVAMLYHFALSIHHDKTEQLGK